MARYSLADAPYLITQFEWAENDDEKYKDLARFNKSLWANAYVIDGLVQSLLAKYQDEETIRYSADKENYFNILKVILLNIALAQLNKKRYITVSLGNNTFISPDIYEPIRITRAIFKNLLDWLVGKDYVNLYIAPPRSSGGMSSVFEPLDVMLDQIHDLEISYKDILHHPKTSHVTLKDKDKNLIDFEHNDETRHRNKILKDYSDLLNKTVISIKGMELQELVFVTSGYNRDLTKGGRIYGGTWQNCPSKDRETIEINGKPTVEIDIRNCSIGMAMQLSGKPIYPEVDLYEIDSFDRSLIKLIINTMLNTSSSTPKVGCSNTANRVFDEIMYESIKSQARFKSPKARKNLMSVISSNQDNQAILSVYEVPYTKAHIRAAVDKIYEHYKPMSEEWLLKGRGLELQNYDSKVCIRVIEEFMRLNKVVLTVHDSFIVDIDDKESLVDTLIHCYHEVIGHEPILKV